MKWIPRFFSQWIRSDTSPTRRENGWYAQGPDSRMNGPAVKIDALPVSDRYPLTCHMASMPGECPTNRERVPSAERRRAPDVV